MHRLSIFYIISVSIVTTQSIFVQTPTMFLQHSLNVFFRLKEKTKQKGTYSSWWNPVWVQSM